VAVSITRKTAARKPEAQEEDSPYMKSAAQTRIRIGILSYCLDLDAVMFAREVAQRPDASVMLYPLASTGNVALEDVGVPILPPTSPLRPVGLRKSGDKQSWEMIAVSPRWLTCFRCAAESDVVILFGLIGTAGLVTGLFARCHNVPVLAVVVSMSPEFELQRPASVRLAKKLLLPLIGAILTRTATTSENLRSVYGYPPERLVHLGCYSSLSRFANAFRDMPLRKHELRAKWDIPDNALALFSAGTFLPQKGFDSTMRALPRLIEAGMHPLLILAGNDGAPPHGNKADLLELRSALGLGDVVRFLGPVAPAQMCELYKAADAFILPTKRDKAPKVLFEAALSGLPLLTTRESAVEGTLLEDGVSGVLLKPDDPGHIADAIRLIADDEVQIGRAHV
jgi:glycosyltransferase involved in cell wall biosynthesis